MAEYEEPTSYDAYPTDEIGSRWAPDDRLSEDDSDEESWEAPFHVPRD